MPTYEMFWDCEACGTTKLLGKSHRYCPNCGSPQDDERRYFPAENEKVAVEDHIFVGVDRTCEACGTANAATAKHCVSCGAGMEGAEEVELQASVEAGKQSGKRASSRSSSSSAPPPRAKAAKKSFVSQRNVVIAVAALLAAIVALLLWSKPTQVTVNEHSWLREVDVQQYSSVNEGAWCASMPASAYSVSRSVRQNGTGSVPDGEDCYEDCTTTNSDNGDGTFSQDETCSTTCTTTYREEPVYEDWCDYTIDRWVVIDTVKTAGNSLSPDPYWASPTVTGCAQLGCTRVGEKRGTYTVDLTDPEGQSHSCELEQNIWASMPVSARYDAEKRVVSGALRCDTLQRIP